MARLFANVRSAEWQVMYNFRTSFECICKKISPMMQNAKASQHKLVELCCLLVKRQAVDRKTRKSEEQIRTDAAQNWRKLPKSISRCQNCFQTLSWFEAHFWNSFRRRRCSISFTLSLKKRSPENWLKNRMIDSNLRANVGWFDTSQR